MYDQYHGLPLSMGKKKEPQNKTRDMLVKQLMNPRQVDNSKMDMQALAPLGVALVEKYGGA